MESFEVVTYSYVFFTLVFLTIIIWIPFHDGISIKTLMTMCVCSISYMGFNISRVVSFLPTATYLILLQDNQQINPNFFFPGVLIFFAYLRRHPLALAGSPMQLTYSHIRWRRAIAPMHRPCS